MKRPQGFTLIEVMISVVIMGVLSLLTYQAIRTASQNRGKIQDLLQNEAKLGDALRVMEHDISRAFHYRNINFEILEASRKEIAKAQAPTPQQGDEAAQQTPGQAMAALAAAPRKPPNYTGFVGDESSLYLTTLSNYRTISNVPQSDQLTVGYFLGNCPGRREGPAFVGQCLIRSHKYILERDIEDDGDLDVVVENVQSLKFRYFGLGQDDWVDRWTSTETGEDFSRGKFPLAVEIALSLYTANEAAEGQSSPPTLQRTIIVPIRFPNNPEGSEPAASGVRDVPL